MQAGLSVRRHSVPTRRLPFRGKLLCSGVSDLGEWNPTVLCHRLEPSVVSSRWFQVGSFAPRPVTCGMSQPLRLDGSLLKEELVARERIEPVDVMFNESICILFSIVVHVLTVRAWCIQYLWNTLHNFSVISESHWRHQQCLSQVNLL